MTEPEKDSEASVGRPAGRGPTTVITDAPMAASAEHAHRVHQYLATMGFRIACFISMAFVHGAVRWVLFACAVVLPYIAVMFANQANQRRLKAGATPPPMSDLPQLTTGAEGEVIDGDVDQESHAATDAASGHERRVA